MTISASTSWRSGVSVGLRAALTAHRAMACVSCFMTVRRGQVYSDSMVPSNEISATSSGIRKPHSWMALRAPSASRSEDAKIASGRSDERSASKVALYPPSLV